MTGIIGIVALITILGLSLLISRLATEQQKQRVAQQDLEEGGYG